ncbi:MAG: Xaa-Pro peptidase family protein [Thermoanaerobacteraceae bacterium]|nr:Xaa-Pro peptidase family protein [Thermoanaerobacteraceae bacterium]
MNRIERLRDGLQEKGIDAALIFEPHNMYYMTGFTGGEGCAVITDNRAYLVTDFRYIEQAENESPDFEVVRVDNQANELSGFINSLSIKTAGFEEGFVSYSLYTDLKSKLEGIELVPLNGLIEDIRQVKDEEEIERISRAQSLAEEALNHVKGLIKPGITEKEVAIELEMYIKKKGSSSLSFETIVASGVRSSLPHGRASDKVIEDGDFVTIDFGIMWDRYCSDMTRTYIVGKVSDKQKEIYNVVLEAQMTALEGMKAGMTGVEADKLARDVIEKYGYGEYFGHGLGHGVGLQVHELPQVNKRGVKPLLENSVVTCEPGIYVPGLGGVRIEDLLVVKNNGILNLTHIDKKLEIL